MVVLTLLVSTHVMQVQLTIIMYYYDFYYHKLLHHCLDPRICGNCMPLNGHCMPLNGHLVIGRDDRRAGSERL